MNESLDVSAIYIAAGSAEASVKCLEEWAENSSASVRRRVAENPRTPLYCLIALARDACTDVQIAIAENHYTPKWLLEELACSELEDLRYSMAENGNLPMDILGTLSQDENPYVAHRAAVTLKRIAPPAKLLKLKRFDKVAEALDCVWQVKIS